MARFCRGPGIPVYLLLLILLMLTATAGTAWAACSDAAPPLPPEGLRWPLTGEVTRGWSLDCKTDRGHRGIDIAAPAGAAVSATAGGTVSFVGYTPAEGGGLTVTIDHEGGLRSSYLHLAEAAVHEGDIVAQGQKIAVGTGTPLHFGIRLPGGAEEYFNPLDLLPPMPADTVPGTVAPILTAETASVPIAKDGPLTPAPEPAALIGEIPVPGIVPEAAVLSPPAFAPEPGYSAITTVSPESAASRITQPVPGESLSVENSYGQPGPLEIPTGFLADHASVSRLAQASPQHHLSTADVEVEGRRRLLLGGLALMLSAIAAAGGRVARAGAGEALWTGSG